MLSTLRFRVLHCSMLSLIAIFLGLTATVASQANEGPPFVPEPEPELGLVFQEAAGPFELEYSENDQTAESRLVIPAHLLRGAIDVGVRNDASAGSIGFTRVWRTVLAGLLLSAAAVSLLLVVRRRKVARAALAAILVGGGLFVAYDLGASRPAVADVLPELPEVSAGVVIEFTEQGETIQFIRGTGN